MPTITTTTTATTTTTPTTEHDEQGVPVEELTVGGDGRESGEHNLPPHHGEQQWDVQPGVPEPCLPGHRQHDRHHDRQH